MRVFIAVDMEGATGVVHPEQLMPDGRGYAAAQKLLTADVNAVIDGVLSVDPHAEIVVGDGHGTMRNILLDQLNPAAKLVIGSAKPSNKPLCQLEGIQFGADVALCVGYHSMAGTASGLFAHTYIGSLIRELRLNGRPAGEVEVNAAVLASFHIPLCFVSGNSDVQQEIRAWNDSSVFVSTKQTLGPTAAICLTPSVSQEHLRQGAATALADRSTWHMSSRGETRIEVSAYRREQCERASAIAGVERVDDVTFAAVADNAADAFRIMWIACVAALDESAAWLS